MFTEHLGAGLKVDAGGALRQSDAYLARTTPVQINGEAHGVRLGSDSGANPASAEGAHATSVNPSWGGQKSGP
jgi:hypothetical protein